MREEWRASEAMQPADRQCIPAQGLSAALRDSPPTSPPPPLLSHPGLNSARNKISRYPWVDLSHCLAARATERSSNRAGLPLVVLPYTGARRYFEAKGSDEKPVTASFSRAGPLWSLIFFSFRLTLCLSPYYFIIIIFYLYSKSHRQLFRVFNVCTLCCRRTHSGVLLVTSSGDGGVMTSAGSFWIITSDCRWIVWRFWSRRSLLDAKPGRPSRFRRRPLVPKFWRVPIDGNRKLHAIPSMTKISYHFKVQVPFTVISSCSHRFPYISFSYFWMFIFVIQTTIGSKGWRFLCKFAWHDKFYFSIADPFESSRSIDINRVHRSYRR